MQPRKEESPFHALHEQGGFIIPNYHPQHLKKMNNNQINNEKGITVQTARILKTTIDYTLYQNPIEKFAEKSAINNRISDSIDKEEEEWCDLVDFLSESAKRGIHQAASDAREQRAKAEQGAYVRETARMLGPIDTGAS